mmetsp:Transcript_6431/g.15549  ORF Transcript_6431/g.15549 Transcript_6431/m.15549 type:complete len:102 (-) Transcript_6431:117-422(-)
MRFIGREIHINPPGLLRTYVKSIMVEGGASVIKSFLISGYENKNYSVDQFVVTIAPTMVGGLNPFCGMAPCFMKETGRAFPRFKQVCYTVVGDDLMMRGVL